MRGREVSLRVPAVFWAHNVARRGDDRGRDRLPAVESIFIKVRWFKVRWFRNPWRRPGMLDFEGWQKRAGRLRRKHPERYQQFLALAERDEQSAAWAAEDPDAFVAGCLSVEHLRRKPVAR